MKAIATNSVFGIISQSIIMISESLQHSMYVYRLCIIFCNPRTLNKTSAQPQTETELFLKSIYKTFEYHFISFSGYYINKIKPQMHKHRR